MNRPEKIKAIYFELRKKIDGDVSAHEVLQYAHNLLEVYETRSDPKCEIYTGGTPFDNWSLDSAFADGGWRVLSHEMKLGTVSSNDDWEGVYPSLIEGRVDLEMMTRNM